jgi:hypothetical protein
LISISAIFVRNPRLLAFFFLDWISVGFRMGNSLTENFGNATRKNYAENGYKEYPIANNSFRPSFGYDSALTTSSELTPQLLFRGLPQGIHGKTVDPGPNQPPLNIIETM